MNGPKFQIYRDNAQEYRHRLKAGNNEITLHASEGYTRKQSCQEGIASVKVNSPLDFRYKRYKAKNDQFYFVLVAGNGEPLAVSEYYPTQAIMEKGIVSVKRDAPGAPTEDLTLNKTL